MAKILEFLGSPVVLGYIAIGLLVLFALAKIALPTKANTIDKVEGITYKVFNFVEKAIPDDLPGTEGSMTKTLQKIDLFAQKFCEAYEKKYGTPPSEKEVEAANTIVEKLVYTKNLQK
jgi:hypothetical protein